MFLQDHHLHPPNMLPHILNKTVLRGANTVRPGETKQAERELVLTVLCSLERWRGQPGSSQQLLLDVFKF